MARPKRIRRVENPPGYKGFLPISESYREEPVTMNLEEYEAIRLSDYELLAHNEAAVRMGVSRPTFTRIYESARRKVAEAFVGKKPIIFEGGKVYFDSEWYHCRTCNSWFNHPDKEHEVKKCALCGSEDIGQFRNAEVPGMNEKDG
jgi:predicted DNA-binding protein (UPF0251 family)